MSSEFRAAAADDLGSITGLLQSAFNASPDAPFLDRALLNWKYFTPGPDWTGSRSYVLVQNGVLKGHGCAWPVKVVCEGRTHTALTLIDWVSHKTSPGAGLAVVRKMASLADILISIGGSAATRQMMPRMGFHTVDEQTLYARVLHPWRQFRMRPGRKTPREIARLLRNARFAAAPRASAGNWTLLRTGALDPQILADSLPSDRPASLRCPALLQYMTQCPGATVELYSLLDAGQPKGYAVVSSVNGQSRIAEIRLPSREPADWTCAVAAIVEAALHSPACELVAWTSDPRLRAALEANGFRPRDRRSIFVQDPQGLISSSGRGWDLTMLDEDAAFLNVPEYPFAT
ncbi:MAG: hypothetical protein LAO79_14250 [Acidobacteriia bacterium]|nr:hypothetical protein [Terriglobia bacterium]